MGRWMTKRMKNVGVLSRDMTQGEKMTKFLANTDSFTELREAGAYYVDKTPVIRELMEDGCMVLMMTRPPKFGRTLFMDTLRTFLDVNPENPGDRSRQEKLFAGLKITEDATFCEKYMG